MNSSHSLTPSYFLLPSTSLDELHSFLLTKELSMAQQKHVILSSAIVKTQMDGSKPCATPLGTQKLDHSGTLISNPREYKFIVRALQYLTWTRPDLSFAMNQLSQFLHCPRYTHFQAVKRVLNFS